jgi:ankyrin repeat protein
MSELIEAAKAGDVARARQILRESPGAATAANAAGETPVMAALYRGHQDLAAEIADAIGAENTPLDVFAAAALGRVDALESALRRSGMVNSYAYDGWTPLHLAAFFGRREAAEQLIAAGAALNATSTNSMRNTPLHAAVAGGRTEVALLLIERGADVSAQDSGQHTPLHIAAENGNAPVVEALLARGADPHAVDAEDKTPLSRAAARNHAAIVDLINVGPGSAEGQTGV